MSSDNPKSTAANPSEANRSAGSEKAILLCCVLAWLGLSISILLVQKSSGLPALFCAVRAGCETVLSSKYSTMMGVPLPWFGAGFYALQLALLLAAYGISESAIRARLVSLAFWIAVLGASFSSVLMFIQFRVLHAFCPLCTASAVVVAALAVASAFAEKSAADSKFVGRPFAAFALAVFTIIPATAQLLPRDTREGEVLAIVDGKKFTREQMEDDVGASLQPHEQAIYDAEFEWVRRKVDGALLDAETAKRKTDVRAEMEARVAAVKPATDEEVAAKLASEALPNSPENVTRAKDELLTEARDQARVTFMEGLAAGHQIDVLLEQPKVRTLQIDLATAKISGPRDAKVQLVVFSDFQCPFCKSLSAVLKMARAEFPNEVLVGYRYFPIESHPRAVPAAIGAECAAEQGAFWEYHDRLYAEGGDMSDARLAAIASELKLDSQKFFECLRSARAKEVVERSRADAIASGLEGAPALFLNGKRISGAIDYEHLREKIEDALQRVAAGSSGQPK